MTGGGAFELTSTEIFTAEQDLVPSSFTPGPELPKGLRDHNAVREANT